MNRATGYGRGTTLLRWLPQEGPDVKRPTWRDAKPRRIARALARAHRNDPGGWYVVGESRDVGRSRSVTRFVDGREVVLWRDDAGTLHAGDGFCPHLGASLGDCDVLGGQVYCRWHGLTLGAGSRGWTGCPALDDGVLIWVRLPVPTEEPSAAPTLPPRPDPDTSIAAVVTRRAVCEPRDIIANRLDPWHGAWFHPYAFSHLTVDENASDDERLVLDVAFRVAGGFAVPVRAEFTCPDARTIVMRILDGEGEGSIVETHATPLGTDPLGRPRTVMTEVTMASSPRPGFQMARRMGPLVQAGMRHTAGRLWVDDLVYAERLWERRTALGATLARV